MKLALSLIAAGVANAQLQASFPDYTARSAGVAKHTGKVWADMDVAAETTAALEQQALTGGFQFAHVHDVDVRVGRDGVWSDVDGGAVWQHSFRLANALSMSFNFDEFQLCDGCAMYVSSEEEVAGAFTQTWSNGKFATRHVSGGDVLLEVFVPTGEAQPRVHLSSVATSFRARGDKAGSCNINAVCVDAERCHGCDPADFGCDIQCTFHDGDDSTRQWADSEWWPQIEASAAVQTASGSRYCSGSLINAQGDVMNPVFLTAHHCIGASPGSDLLLFGFRAEECTDSNDTNGPTDKTVGDLSILTSNAKVDDSYLSVGERIPDAWNTYMSGFESRREQIENVVGLVGIHNPAASITKVSHSELAPTLHAYSGTGDDHWRVAHWTEGTTEGGSSGSALYQRDTKRIIGQLHGGTARCPAYAGWDSYGAVSHSFERAQRFLGAEFADGRSTSDFYREVDVKQRRKQFLKL